MSENILKVENATMQFGGVVAVDNLNLEINQGEIVALIGPNGAGKTTAFNVVTGVYQPTNGAVWFQGEKIIENHPQGKMKTLYKGEHAGEYSQVLAPTPDKITKLGMARTFQNIRLWKSQTVFENVLIAKHCRSSSNFLSAAFRLTGGRGPAEGRGRAAAEDRGIDGRPGRAGDLPALRQAAPPGDCPGFGHGAEAVAAGRTGGGHESPGDG